VDAKHDRPAWLKGPAFQCEIPNAHIDRPWRLVLLGAPGVGKGTQAELLSERFGACHLSTGDVFRVAKCLTEGERRPSMSAALEYMRGGELVPDVTVLEMVRERVGCLRCRGGFLLDGFPRTVAQAEALQAILKEQNVVLDGVLSYELAIEEVVARLSGRRICPTCKAVFHVTGRPPKVRDVCDQCASPIVQREDDRPEAVRVRLAAYETSTAPLVDFYRRLGLLRTVAVGAFPEETFRRTMVALQTNN
jgi:adenylate kinase